MSRTNDIHSEMWSTEEFAELSPHAKLVYIWSFTNADCGMAGLFKIARRAIAFATGLTPDEVRAALEELTAARFVFYADGVMFVRARVKHLRMKTRQIAKSIGTSVRRLPVDHPMRVAFMEEYGHTEWLQGELFPDEDSTPKDAPQEPQRGSTLPPTQESPTLAGNGKGRGKGTGVVVESTTDDGRARIAKGIASGIFHSALLDVLDIVAEAPELQVEEASINSALLSRPDVDWPGAARLAVSWTQEPKGSWTKEANRLLLSAATSMAKEDAKVKAATEYVGPRPIATTGRRSSVAEEIARREQAAEAQLAREAAEAEGRAAA